MQRIQHFDFNYGADRCACWFVACIALLLHLLVVNSTCANEPPQLRGGDELWLVSSRCLPDLEKCVTLQSVKFEVSRFQCGAGWTASDEQQLATSFTELPHMRTVVYAHGNWMTPRTRWSRIVRL